MQLYRTGRRVRELGQRTGRVHEQGVGATVTRLLGHPQRGVNDGVGPCTGIPG
jgi:hypothetical protein